MSGRGKNPRHYVCSAERPRYGGRSPKHAARTSKEKCSAGRRRAAASELAVTSGGRHGFEVGSVWESRLLRRLAVAPRERSLDDGVGGAGGGDFVFGDGVDVGVGVVASSRVLLAWRTVEREGMGDVSRVAELTPWLAASRRYSTRRRRSISRGLPSFRGRSAAARSATIRLATLRCVSAALATCNLAAPMLCLPVHTLLAAGGGRTGRGSAETAAQ